MRAPRADLYEVAQWEDMHKVDGIGVFYSFMLYNQAIVIPETIDAIRAPTGTTPNGVVSIATTNRALGIGRWS